MTTDRLFALAELSFLHAEASGQREYYLAAAAYAYAFVLPEREEGVIRPSIHEAGWRSTFTTWASPWA